MTERSEQRRDRDLLAAELALGLLDGPEHADAQRALLSDPAFRASHAFWSAKAGEWLESVPAGGEAPNLLTRIEDAIDAEANPAVDAVPERNGGFARAWAIAATVAAVLAIGSTVLFQQREAAALGDNAALARQLAQAEGERQVAQITGEASRVLVSALYDPAQGTITLKLDVPNEPARVPELWVIPGDGQPRSLGTFITASAEIAIDPALRPYLTDGAKLAITMEPETGAPHAAPTGPILGATELKSL
ncbi:anti-sigma factor [Tsuneonella amylolytica]|uniref:anti-sigma factor n=1 Tax=Tsuneonella amylolytica TaxID=2338327 RepID=UPI000EA8C86D|nr:anti-sigma factor [Tsuneonella amylolytica]